MANEERWDDWLSQMTYICDPFDHILKARGVKAVRVLCEEFLEKFPAMDESDPVYSVRRLCRMILDELHYEETGTYLCPDCDPHNFPP